MDILTRQVLTEKSPYKLVNYMGAEEMEGIYNTLDGLINPIRVSTSDDLTCYVIMDGKYMGSWIYKFECEILKNHV
jgi:hypothetical protein